ncbi:MAG: thioredoxin domain-containing protein [Luteolibacter sp.]
MLSNFRPHVMAFGLVMVVSALSSCDRFEKIKAAAGKLGTTGKPAQVVPEVKGTYSRDQISNLDEAGFPAFIARKNALVIVDYNATWCGPCKMMGPALDKAAEAHPGVVFVGKVDVDRANGLAKQQGVSGIPDVRIYKDGKEVDRMVGFPGESVVLGKIAGLAAGITPVAAAVSTAPKTAEPEIQPFSKGWLPPGMKRGGAEPAHRP